MKNKAVSIAIVLILSVAIIGGVATFVIMNLTKSEEPAPTNGQPTIEQIVETSVDTEEITTNLKDNHYIKVSFKLQAENSEAKLELEKRLFQVKDIVIKELAQLTTKDLAGKEGIIQLENTVKAKTNELMQKGTVLKVYTTSFILQ